MAGFSLNGVIPALLTPFDVQGRPDLDLLSEHVRALEAKGMTAFCVGGPGAEMAGCTPGEYRTICAAVTATTSKPVAAAIYPDSTREALAFAEAALGAGASALLVAQPHYLFQPDGSGLEELFSTLRQVVPVPLVLSNSVPSAPLDLERIQRLTDAGLIDAVHQGDNDAHLLADLLAASPRIPVLAGIESLMLLAFLLGAEGVVGTLAAVFPEDCLALHEAAQRSDFDAARSIHERLLRLWRAVSDPAELFARLKFASAAQGRPLGTARSPYEAMAQSSEVELRRALVAEGKI